MKKIKKWLINCPENRISALENFGAAMIMSGALICAMAENIVTLVICYSMLPVGFLLIEIAEMARNLRRK